MALTATIYTFEIDLADSDRGAYETLSLRVARHPSESEEYFAARVLAYCLEYTEGLSFSAGGLSDPDEPALSVRDLTGAIRAWIEIGAPDPARLHRAAKVAPRVAVYLQKEPTQYLRQLAGAPIHRGDALELYAIDRALIAALVARLERRTAFALSISDRHLYVSIGTETLDGPVDRLSIPEA